MKTLRTVYPYGLNDRAKKHDHNSPVGRLFPSLPRFSHRTSRSRANRNNHAENTSVENFFDNVQNILNNNIKDALYTIRIMLDNVKKKLLKNIASEILHNLHSNPKYEHIYVYILDIIDTKLYKTEIKTRKCPPENT